MRATSLAFLFAFLAVSFAVSLHSTTQASLDASKAPETPADINTVIRSLMQLTQQDDDFQRVFQILDQIRLEIGDLLKKSRDNFETEKNNYETSKTELETSIAKYVKNIDENGQELQAQNLKLSDTREIIRKASEAITKAKADIEAEKVRRAQVTAASKQSVADIDSAIGACEEAIRIMEKIQQADLSQERSQLSFLETSRQQLHARLLHIKEKIKKVKTMNPIGPFIATLVEIAQAQSTLNADLIQKIIDMIRSLRSSLETERENAVEADKKDAEVSQNALDSYTTTISAETSVLTQNQKFAEDTQNRITQLEGQIDSDKIALEKAQANLQSLNTAFAARQKGELSFFARLERDIQAIDAALTYLRSKTQAL